MFPLNKQVVNEDRESKQISISNFWENKTASELKVIMLPFSKHVRISRVSEK